MNSAPRALICEAGNCPVPCDGTSLLLVELPSLIELRDPALGTMLAAPFRFNILEDIAEIPLENISANDFAARFLAIVARQVPKEDQTARDAYEAAMPVDAAIFGALSKNALDALVRVYLAAEAKSMVVKPHQIGEITNTLPGERESERLLRLVKTVTEELKEPTPALGQVMAAIDSSFRARLELYPKLADKIV